MNRSAASLPAAASHDVADLVRGRAFEKGFSDFSDLDHHYPAESRGAFVI